MNESDPSQELPQYSSGILIIRGVTGQGSTHTAYLIGTENYNVICRQLAQADYAYSPANPPTKTAKTRNTRVSISKTYSVGNIYNLSEIGVSSGAEYIGGIIKHSSLIGQVINSTQFIVLVGTTAAAGTDGTLYYYEF